MTVKCCARYCASEQDTKYTGDKLKFFEFPTDQEVRQQWENISKNSTKENDQDQRHLCELHFDKSCFNSERLLKPDSTPRPCLLKRSADMNKPEIEQKIPKIKNKKSDSINLVPITFKEKSPVNDNELNQSKSKPYRLVIQIDKVYLKPCPKSKKINQIKIKTQNIENNLGLEKDESLVKHTDTNKDESKNSYHCLVCKKMFTVISELHTHVKEHFTCEICKIEFTSIGSYKKHFELHTSDVKKFPYRCHICDILFETKELLKFHNKLSLNTHNRKENNIIQNSKKCKNDITHSKDHDSHVQCNASSVTSNAHRKILPKGPVPEPFASSIIFSCRICNRSFTSAVDIDIHTKSHLEEFKTKSTK